MSFLWFSANLLDEQSYRSTGRFDLQDKAEIERDYLKQESFTWNLLYSLEIGRKQQPGSEWKSHSYDRNLCILHWLETGDWIPIPRRAPGTWL